MDEIGFMWECKCGNTIYGEESPEECDKCFRLDSFVQLPEEIVAEREKDMVEGVGEAITLSKKLSNKTKRPGLKKPAKKPRRRK